MQLFIISVIIVIILIFLAFLGTRVEKFIDLTTDPIINNSNNIDSDDLGFSEYDNISLTRDIDSLQQRVPIINFPGNSEIDNSDLITQIVNHGDTVFQPAHGFGVSTTSNASMNSFTLGGPSGLPFLDDESVYDSPTNGQINIDEKLAINQQHRGSIAKKAIEGFVRNTRNVYQKYFTDELNENSNRIWWDNSSDEGLETDFGPDI